MAPAVDDYSLSRVPASARYPWWSVAVQRFGQVSALTQFMLGAALGFGLSFWDAFWALTFGALILEAAMILVGIIGMREGLSTSMLARWTGFGRGGSAVIGLAIGISLVGWFGIQSGISARGLHALIGGPPEWVWAIGFGLAVTAIVIAGFRSMAWTAYVTVPLFLALVAWSIISELSGHSLGALVSSPPPGPPMTVVQGTALVAGSLMVGAVITSDMTRFNRNAGDVIKQTVIGVTLGEYVIGLAGVLLAHAVGSSDIIAIVVSSVGLVGTLVIVAGTLKINDWNLYSAGLGLLTFIGVVSGRRPSRVLITALVGVAGTLLGAAGILDRFTDFLILLGVVFPPIAGIMIAEYFVVRRWRGRLAEGRDTGAAPAGAPMWVPVTLVIWVVATLIGVFVTAGLGSVNSLVAAFALYVACGRLGLITEVGASATENAEGANA
ncbi:purine-cytosine permease family protein [Nonomuraea sp. NPDC059194]|uniref:purine-cytosine permease family protein n=1 Tax=Nonomuraea sp. NPDC059194 TaxID=3346764 RepID=UPI0036C4FE73